MKHRFRRKLTDLKLAKSEIDLRETVQETFAETDPRVCRGHIMRGWRNLLVDDPNCPVHFQGLPLRR